MRRWTFIFFTTECCKNDEQEPWYYFHDLQFYFVANHYLQPQKRCYYYFNGTKVSLLRVQVRLGQPIVFFFFIFYNKQNIQN